MTQRQPREEDPAYLAYVRTLPCLVCGRPSEAAHLRSPALRYRKRHTGMGEKSDDKWALPLCRPHHTAQHRMNELEWWASVGVANPFAVAADLYARRPGASQPTTERRRRLRVTKPRKPKADRNPPKGRNDLKRGNNQRTASTPPTKRVTTLEPT